jgi:hypothetical protein
VLRFAHKPFQNGKNNMSIQTIIVDLASSRQHLDELKADPTMAPQFDYCTTLMEKLDSTISDLITLPWIPKSVPGLDGAISSVLHNIRKAETSIDECLDGIWDRQVPVEILRADLALIALDTLRFQLGVLIDVRIHMLRNTLGNIEAEFVN